MPKSLFQAYYIQKNLPQFIGNKNEEYANEIIDLIIDITSMILCIYILIEPSCIQSSDFSDYLDVGMQPPKDCQYWVAGIALSFIMTT